MKAHLPSLIFLLTTLGLRPSLAGAAPPSPPPAPPVAPPTNPPKSSATTQPAPRQPSLEVPDLPDICHPEAEYGTPPAASLENQSGNLVLLSVPKWSKHNVGLTVSYVDETGRATSVKGRLRKDKKKSESCQEQASLTKKLKKAKEKFQLNCKTQLLCEETKDEDFDSNQKKLCPALLSSDPCGKEKEFQNYRARQTLLSSAKKACSASKRSLWSVQLPAPRAGAGPVKLRLRFTMRATKKLDDQLVTTVAASLARLTIRAGYIFRDVGYIRTKGETPEAEEDDDLPEKARKARDYQVYARLNQLLQDIAREPRPCQARYTVDATRVIDASTGDGDRLTVSDLAGGFLGLRIPPNGGAPMVTRDSLDLAQGRLIDYIEALCRYNVIQACKAFLDENVADRSNAARPVRNRLRKTATAMIDGKQKAWEAVDRLNLRKRIVEAFTQAVPEVLDKSVFPSGQIEVELEVAENMKSKKKSPYFEIATGVYLLPDMGETVIPAMAKICPASCLTGDEIWVNSWEEAGRALSFDFGLGVATLDDNADPRRGDNITLFTGVSYELFRIVSISGGVSIFENAQTRTWNATPYFGISASVSDAVEIFGELRGVNTKLVKKSE